MVDVASLAEASSLNAELNQIDHVLDAFDAGGRIVSMSVQRPDQPMALPVSIPTRYMTYPAAMVDAIKASMQTRQNEIVARLTQLGITGVQ